MASHTQNVSSSKQSHAFSKRERFPDLTKATIAISPASYKINSKFDEIQRRNESFKVKEERFRYYQNE